MAEFESMFGVMLIVILGAVFFLLDLGHNSLTGSVPEMFSRLAALERLYLSHNPLSGPLPRFLVGLTLKSFWFEDTALCEPGDAEFQGWKGKVGTYNWTGTRIICTE